MHDLVTLLIGVNDQYRGLGINYYQDGLLKLLNKAMQIAGNDADKMVDHVLELKGYKILFSGQMTPSIKIEKIIDIYQPDRIYISSTFVTDVNLTPAEFDKICYIAPRRIRHESCWRSGI